ncbi:MAG: isoprenylcysteine carboxylmethyltransferase family protein [Elusimicrobia bacterium]|nr:isoprenylcysteine carboxylmethyltransferase family protein [Elusimicrobiota bacterium]
MNLNRFRLYLMRFSVLVYFFIFFRVRKEVIPLAFFIGLILTVKGELTRVLAQSTIDKDRKLAKEGLYACCRNPLYLGSFFIATGFLCFTVTAKFHPEVFIFWLIVITVNFVVYRKKIKDEEKRLTELFGAEFVNYKMNVPVFFPKPKEVLKHIKNLKINPKQIVGNREHKMFLGLVIMLIVITGGIFYY